MELWNKGTRKVGEMSDHRARVFGAAIAAALVAAGVVDQRPATAAHAHHKAKAVAAAEASTAPTSTSGIETQAKHAFVLDADTGTVLLDKGADERMPPASMSKIMTAYVVFDMLKQGRAKPAR